VQELVNLQTPSRSRPSRSHRLLEERIRSGTQTNTEFTKATERRVTEWNENFVSLLDKPPERPGRLGCSP